MYNEGTTKAIWAILIAVLLAVALAFKTQTLFLLRFVFDLVKLNAIEWLRGFLAYTSQHWHFWPFSQ